MRQLIDLRVSDLTPTPNEVFAHQGMAGRTNIPEKIKDLLDSALELFQQLADPKGIMQELPLPDFMAIYDGNGLNTPEGPVPGIVARADGLALFAATMGSSLMSKSTELFAKGGPALGFMLDAVNSCAAERLGRQMGLLFANTLQDEITKARKLRVQYYCPGHCGWHISGQTRLFRVLHPEEIDITLNDRWVMQPAKSLSGILVAGEMDIHRFMPAFSFCAQCKEHKCVQRLLFLESEN